MDYQAMTAEKFMARPVRIASICLGKGVREAEKELLAEVDTVGAEGTDLVLTPEVWTEDGAEPAGEDFTSPALDALKEKAKKYHTYICACMRRYATPEEEKSVREANAYWKEAGRIAFNSQLLIDREGKIVHIYDKVYPFPAEFNRGDMANATFTEMKASPLQEVVHAPGDHSTVYEADFGRLGFATCFDMNFPRLFQKMAAQDAELLIWESAFDGGVNLQAEAAINNYYIVTCTGFGTGGCRVEDMDGSELLYVLPEEGEKIHTTRLTLNLDRMIFHRNYNEGKITEALKKYEGKIGSDYSHYPTAEWIILWSETPEFSMKDICREFDLVPLRQFKTTAEGDWIDSLRGKDFV